ncbi:hypothetical protein [Moorena sp. SIO3H5]|uniref:hypothetical protein n=1 Tax=Moorena sp. SIO3H5 TaxID=2607834 RepID=UPI0013B9C1B8|nr:hypothetical protein [Moorena sp. SIO3H5]NEO68918.1 hypothetical protein [Moorena sp. SIO3H5]
MTIEISSLTNIPKTQDAKNGINITIIISILIFFSYSYYHFIVGDSYDFFIISTLLMTVHAVFTIPSFNQNIIITFRYFLIFLPVYATSILWWLSQGVIRTHYLGYEYQTLSTTTILVTGGALSVFGATFGWYLGSLRIRKNLLKTQNALYFIRSQRNLLATVGCIGSIFFGILYVFASGGILAAGKAYSSGEAVGIGVKFAVFNIFQIFFASLGVISLQVINSKEKWIIYSLLVLGFFMGFLVGSRADYMLPILILSIYILSIIERFRITNVYYRLLMLKAGLKLSRNILPFLVLAIIVGYFVSTAIATWRYNPSLDIFSLLIENVVNFRDLLFPTIKGHQVLWMETACHMIGGFYGMIAQRELAISDFLKGESYLHMIPRSLPGFIRPSEFDKLDLAWHTGVNGTIMSQGGIFEPAEAYANFGVLGCFFVSAIISYFFTWLLKKSFKLNSIFFMAWYLTCGFMLLRGVWYQNFSFVRIATVMLVFYILLFVFKKSWINKKIS